MNTLIAAAKLVHMEQYNPQSQPRIEWPAAFPVSRALLDQVIRNKDLAERRTTAIARALDTAERQTGAARRTALERLARELNGDARSSRHPERLRALAESVNQLARAAR